MAEKTKAYRIGDQPYYRPGVGYFDPGSVVHIPEGEKPSKTWTPVEDKPATPTPTPTDTNPKKRPSDRDVA